MWGQAVVQSRWIAYGRRSLELNKAKLPTPCVFYWFFTPSLFVCCGNVGRYRRCQHRRRWNARKASSWRGHVDDTVTTMHYGR